MRRGGVLRSALSLLHGIGNKGKRIMKWWPRQRREEGTKEERNRRYRLARIEPLESRQLLSVTALTAFGNTTALVAGSPGWVGINGTAGENEKLTYTVSIDSSNLTGGTLSYELMSGEANRSLKIDLETADQSIDGTLLLQLFEEYTPNTVEQIAQLAEDGAYDGSTFHRMIKDFMIQGGKVDETVRSFDDEFYADSQFTSAGLLAMANSGIDTNSSQFFVTTNTTRWLDYNHTIFGMLTEGNDILESLNQNVSVSSSDDSSGTPKQTVTMTDVSVVNDAQNAVLKLVATAGTTGSATITLTATDESGGTLSKKFTVTVGEDSDGTNANPLADPALGTIEPITLTAGKSFTGTLPVFNADGQTLTYTFAPATASASAITATLDTTTLRYTITAADSVACGVYTVSASVCVNGSTVSSDGDSQSIPVLIVPAAPTVALNSSSDTGTSTTDGVTKYNNDGSDQTLSFDLTGVTSGATVNVYAGTTLIATGTVPTGSTTLTLASNGTAKLADGTYSITAEQVQSITSTAVGNSTYDRLASDRSTAVSVTVSTTNGKPTATVPTSPVAIQPRTTETDAATEFTISVSDGDEEVTQTLTAEITTQATHGTVTVVDATTGKFSYTPQVGYTGEDTFTFTLTDTDLAGNDAQTSDPVTITLNVAETENLETPTGEDQVVSVWFWKKQFTVQLGGSVTNSEGANLTYKLGDLPSPLSVSSFDEKTGELVLNLDDRCSGLRKITYTVVNTGENSSVESEPATIRVNVVKYNRVPKAYNQKLTVERDGTLTIQLTGSNGEKAKRAFVQDIEYRILVEPRHGTLEAIDAAAGTYRYTPSESFRGYDFIFFRTRDDGFGGLTAKLYSGVGYIRISMADTASTTNSGTDQPDTTDSPSTNTNTAPLASAVNVSVASGSSTLITLSGTDADEGATLTYTVTQQPEHGTVTKIDDAGSVLLYTPESGFSGNDTLLYKVKDEYGAESDVAIVTVTVNVS